MKSSINKKQITGIAIAVLISLSSSFSGLAQAYGWYQNVNKDRWWYALPDGTIYTSSWQWIDGNRDGIAECYRFDYDGYIFTDTVTPDGYTVNADGAWAENGVVQQRNVPVTIAYGINDTPPEEYLQNKEAYRDEVLRLVNNYRKELGKPALNKNESLQDLAQVRAEEIAESYSHTRTSTGDTLGWEDGVNGEVIMRLVSTPFGAVSAWRHSTGHDRLLRMKSYKEAGVGYYVTEEGKQYWVMLFRE